MLQFMDHCDKPIITTLHTLLTRPAPIVRSLVRKLADRSHVVIVMTHVAARLLTEVYGVPTAAVRVIPHGVPAVPFTRNDSYK